MIVGWPIITDPRANRSVYDMMDADAIDRVNKELSIKLSANIDSNRHDGLLYQHLQVYSTLFASTLV